MAAYSIEGGSSKHALNTKKMMMEEPALFHSLMTKYANSIGDYACYQVRLSGLLSAITKGARIGQINDPV